jgi:Fe-Mn family superoxide dismutase
MNHTLPELSYDYDSLTPHIDAKTMEIHHTKHHQGYVNNLNTALESAPDLQTASLEELLNGLDEAQSALRNNGGGHYNHSLFWRIMSPQGGGKPDGDLAQAIDQDFGGFEKFKEEFTAAAGTRFGSGWAWLGVADDGKLLVCSTPNQDNPLMKKLVDSPCTPILGLDVWEHAYYLNYQNKRPDYISAWWNVVNWAEVTKNYQATTS